MSERLNWNPFVHGFDLPMRTSEPGEWNVRGIFRPDTDDNQIAAAFGVMAMCPAHRFFVAVESAERYADWKEFIASEAELLPELVGEVPHEGTSAEACACVMMANDQLSWNCVEAPEEETRRRCDAYEASPWPLRNVTMLEAEAP